jgi:phage terminase small subunit
VGQINDEYLDEILNNSPEQTFIEMVFKKYIEFEGAVNVARFLNGNGFKVKTKSKKGKRNYTSVDITDMVLDKENQKQVNIKLAFLVDKLARYVGRVPWMQKLNKVLKFMANDKNKINEWKKAPIEINTGDMLKVNRNTMKKENKRQLTDKQKLFCLNYIKNFNEKQAAINAGYPTQSAHIQGRKLLKEDSIRNYIKELKQKTADDLMIDAYDVLDMYKRIAYADMADFTEFGERECIQFDEEGLILKNEKGEAVTTKRPYLKFKESHQVDGGLISEISTGKNGMKLKLEDRQKALDKLAILFDLFPDKFSRELKEKELNHRIEQDNKKDW